MKRDARIYYKIKNKYLLKVLFISFFIGFCLSCNLKKSKELDFIPKYYLNSFSRTDLMTGEKYVINVSKTKIIDSYRDDGGEWNTSESKILKVFDGPHRKKIDNIIVYSIDSDGDLLSYHFYLDTDAGILKVTFSQAANQEIIISDYSNINDLDWITHDYGTLCYCDCN
jgi:hypothetical protein